MVLEIFDLAAFFRSHCVPLSNTCLSFEHLFAQLEALTMSYSRLPSEGACLRCLTSCSLRELSGILPWSHWNGYLLKRKELRQWAQTGHESLPRPCYLVPRSWILLPYLWRIKSVRMDGGAPQGSLLSLGMYNPSTMCWNQRLRYFVHQT